MNNNIQDSYCSFEVSKLLKEKAYRNDTVYYYIDIDNKHTSHRSMSTGHILGMNWNSFPSEKNSSRVSCPTHALAIEWISVNFGVITWVSPHPLSSSGGWSYNIIQYAAGVLKAYVIERASSVSLSRQEATEESLLYILKNLI